MPQDAGIAMEPPGLRLNLDFHPLTAQHVISGMELIDFQVRRAFLHLLATVQIPFQEDYGTAHSKPTGPIR